MVICHPQLSTDEAEAFTRQLQEFLMNTPTVYESEAMKIKRKQVLTELSQVVKDWIVKVERTVRDKDDNPNAEIFPFGSYGFDVHGPDSDIDVLCVGPNYANRDVHFFCALYDILAGLPQVSELWKIPKAYVPVMKFKFDGVAIDMVYSNLGLRTLPNDLNLLNMDLLIEHSSMDKKSILSVNGYRNVEEIKDKIVLNEENYRIALRALRLWAERRSIYSNVAGFLGGINLAILLAFVTYHNPGIHASELVTKFFFTFSEWSWPSPVSLETTNIPFSPVFDGDLVWNPKEFNKIDLMPIITPAMPYSSNSAPNVCASSLAVMKEEFQIGWKICLDILSKNKEWDVLFESYPFFEKYRIYVQVEVIADTADLLRVWKGYVESRLRNLALDIERFTQMRLYAHINLRSFTDPNDLDKNRCFYFIGLHRNKNLKIKAGHQDFDVSQMIYDFRHRLTLRSAAWKEESRKIIITLINRQEIPEFAVPKKGLSPLKRKHNGESDGGAQQPTSQCSNTHKAEDPAEGEETKTVDIINEKKRKRIEKKRRRQERIDRLKRRNQP